MDRFRQRVAALLERKKDKAKAKGPGPQHKAPSVTRPGRAPILSPAPTPLSSSPIGTSTLESTDDAGAVALVPSGHDFLSLVSGNNSVDSLQGSTRSGRSYSSVDNTSILSAHSFSSQHSDGSVDGTLTALHDLIGDHIKLLAKRGRDKDAEGKLAYIKALTAFRIAVETQKPLITEHNHRREEALVRLYHDLAGEFISLVTELGRAGGGALSRKLHSSTSSEGQNVVYDRFQSRLEVFRQRFACSISMAVASPPPLPAKRSRRAQPRSNSAPGESTVMAARHGTAAMFRQEKGFGIADYKSSPPIVQESTGGMLPTSG